MAEPALNKCFLRMLPDVAYECVVAFVEATPEFVNPSVPSPRGFTFSLACTQYLVTK